MAEICNVCPARHRLVVLLLFFSIMSTVCGELERFNQWYPRYSDGLNNILQTTCLKNYQAYHDRLNGVANSTAIPNPDILDWEKAPDPTIAPLIDCLLTALPQIVSSSMAASQVLLGLMPTIVILLAPRIQDTAMLLALGRRPLVGLLLSFGAPFTATATGINYRSEFEALRDDYNWTKFTLSPTWRTVVSIIEYIAILGCIANNAWLGYEIPKRASFSLFQESYYLPGFWAFSGVIVRLMAAVALRIDTKARQSHRYRSWLPLLARPEINESQIVLYPPSLLTAVISWISIISSVVILVGGTVIFSTILFVGARDAVGILLRFMLSGVVCKLVAMYEMSYLRAEIAVSPTEKPGKHVVEESMVELREEPSSRWQFPTSVQDKAKSSTYQRVSGEGSNVLHAG